ncbi:cuticle protein 7-like [Schistocerca serialis cubense]|uniref:cuticle protein 7-like n=1 Tax=Schistocerca serialis cubense TaxID=2023355 RepID=UPI00214E561E|nr:cuticle protein 7-like [Schistocerca serialis cubense]
MCHNGGLRRVPGGEPAPTFALQSTRRLFVYIRGRARRGSHTPTIRVKTPPPPTPAAAAAHEIIYDYVAPASYRFDYAVRDGHTGDAKTQWEHRDGDTVRGAYSLVDADGTTRIVEYTADPHNGFRAEVKRLGHPAPPPPQPSAQTYKSD